MNAAHDELLHRREQLRSRSAALRMDWAQQVQGLRQPLRVADRVRDGVHWLVEHPQWPLSAALILVVLRPRRALRWATFAWQGYSLYRRVQRGLPRPRSPRH
jgi:hypothetical protein